MLINPRPSRTIRDCPAIMGHDRTDTTLAVFYRTERLGAVRLPDGGGPFGFDITVALIVDDLIAAYAWGAIVETGCFLGDITSYLTPPDEPMLGNSRSPMPPALFLVRRVEFG